MPPRSAPAADLLLRALRAPESLIVATEREWDLLLRVARGSYLLAHLACRMENLLDQLPRQVVAHFKAAENEASERHRIAMWEIDRLARALADTGTPVI